MVESGDDAFFTERAYEAVEKGDFNKVTMIVGMNSEEWIGRVSSKMFSNVCTRDRTYSIY